MSLVAIYWQHRFNNMVSRNNDIYRVQIPNFIPHVCSHTYCSNQTKIGMNTKTLQYIMEHSNISVMMNMNTHIGFDDIEEEFKKLQVEIEKKNKKQCQRQYLWQYNIEKL